MRKKFFSLLFGFSLMLTLVVGTGQPASAGPTVHNLKVTVTQTMCPWGGTVYNVKVHITEPGSIGMSSGDTATGLSAFSAQPVMVIGTNHCYRPWGRSYENKNWQVIRYFWFSGQRTYI